MTLGCRLAGHSWLQPTWEFNDCVQRCSRCGERRTVLSFESLAKRFGVFLLTAVPADASAAILDRTLKSQRDKQLAALVLQQLGLLKDGCDVPLPVSLVPSVWLPALRVAVEELGVANQIDSVKVRLFWSSFGAEAVPYLLESLHSTWRIRGEMLSESIVGTTELTESGTTSEEEHGGSMGRTERGYYHYSEVYEADLVERTFSSTRPIFEGAKAALSRIAAGDPERRSVIEREVAANEGPHVGHVTERVPENKRLLTTDKRWVSTYRDVDAR